MRDIQVSVSGTSTGSPIPLDYIQNPFQVSLSVGNVVGTIAATLQYTYDRVFDSTYDPSTGNWYTHPLMSGITAAGDCVINAGPVRAVRFNNVGTGSFTARVLQSGNP